MLAIGVPVDEFSAYAAFEESTAAIAGQDAVVFPARRVSAHETGEARRASLHQGRRQRRVDGASADADRRTASGRRRCRYGCLVQHHPVDHRRRQD